MSFSSTELNILVVVVVLLGGLTGFSLISVIKSPDLKPDQRTRRIILTALIEGFILFSTVIALYVLNIA